MGVQSLTGGNATNRVGVATTEDEQQRRADRDTAARRSVLRDTARRFPDALTGDPEAIAAAREQRDYLHDVLGLDGGNR